METSVDAETRLIVAHDVTNIGLDRRQLSPMANKAKSVIAANDAVAIKVVTNQGCYRGEELLAREASNITAYVAKTDTSGKRGKSDFQRSRFCHVAEVDEYECPAGERTIYRYSRSEAGKLIRT